LYSISLIWIISPDTESLIIARDGIHLPLDATYSSHSGQFLVHLAYNSTFPVTVYGKVTLVPSSNHDVVYHHSNSYPNFSGAGERASTVDPLVAFTGVDASSLFGLNVTVNCGIAHSVPFHPCELSVHVIFEYKVLACVTYVVSQNVNSCVLFSSVYHVSVVPEGAEGLYDDLIGSYQ
jgi:hypothetical protein